MSYTLRLRPVRLPKGCTPSAARKALQRALGCSPEQIIGTAVGDSWRPRKEPK